MAKLVGRKEVLDVLKIHFTTLYDMIKRKEIEAVKIGNKNLYNLEKYLKDNNISSPESTISNKEETNNKIRKRICYCRVSSNHQKEDLQRQIELVKQYYPNHEIIHEIGSGLNFKRKGFLRLLDMSYKGEIEELVVVYKDRLCRFGFEMIEYIIQTFSKGIIIVMNRTEEKTPTEEITEDILAIMNIYVAKINGLRKYKKAMKKELVGECTSDSE
jgi:predicted site-specific integrase-resolvase